MVRCRSLLLLLATTIATLACPIHSFSVPNGGSAATPFEKKTIAVFGGGGYLGAIAFGFLQRAGSLYPTGISGSPRCISATSVGTSALNTALSQSFLLAQADESMLKLVDMTSNVQRIKLGNGVDAAILATRCRTETRPVTVGTYETSPNSKTKEFYADNIRSGRYKNEDDAEYSAMIFQNTIQACKGLKHIVIVETDASFGDDATSPKTTSSYLETIQECGIPFTYIKPSGAMENFKDYTYVKGVQGDLKIEKVDPNEIATAAAPSSSSTIYREDIAACCVQSLMSLDWSQSRCLSISSVGPLSWPKVKRVDREWCVGSENLASKLEGL